MTHLEGRTQYQARLGPERQTDEARRTSYKAEIAKVSPPESRHTFTAESCCVLGVSLDNDAFTGAKLRGMVRWISRHFKECLVLVGDSIHRITLESVKSMDPTSARERAHWLGQQFIVNSRPIFEEFAEDIDLSFVTCGEVQSWSWYRAYHGRLLDSFERISSFRESVTNFSRKYHSRDWATLSVDERVERIDRSCEYFLEEFAIFACLRRQGNRVLIYPGSFSTLTEVAQGKHAGVLEDLRDLIVVSLNLRGR